MVGERELLEVESARELLWYKVPITCNPYAPIFTRLRSGRVGKCEKSSGCDSAIMPYIIVNGKSNMLVDIVYSEYYVNIVP